MLRHWSRLDFYYSQFGGAPVPRDVKSNSELEFLTAIERGEVVTQMTLRKRIGVSIGLINALLRRGMHKGYVKARKAPFKRYAYYVTPNGFSEKSRLVKIYLENSLAFYRGARSEYGEIFARARTDSLSRLVLVGRGELAEIAVIAAWGEGLTLLALLDSQTDQDQHYGVRVIRSLEEIGPFDAVVITDSRTPQQAYEDMRERLSEAQVLAPPLLKITRDRADLIAAAQTTEQA
jgi:DNA-binding MarR family transcriptional regulator